MSAEIINLRQVRKQRERERKAAEAEENRVRFGRTKAERTLAETAHARAERTLDGHLRTDTDTTADTSNSADDSGGNPDHEPKSSPDTPQ